MRRPTALTLAALVAFGEARAGELFHRHRGTPPPGAPRAIPHTPARAGFAACLSPHAGPSNTPAYQGGYVGGGAGSSYGGNVRRPAEGTFGWDYVGNHLSRRVFPGWSHGRRAHGGAVPPYVTDGPRYHDPIGRLVTGVRSLHGGE
jgi:hypothetical protein